MVLKKKSCLKSLCSTAYNVILFIIIAGLLYYQRIKITLADKPNEFENEIFKQ